MSFDPLASGWFPEIVATTCDSGGRVVVISSYTTELRQIRGLELRIDDVRAKFKIDGAEPDAVRRQVADGYARRSSPSDPEALAHLLRRHRPADR